MMDLAAAEEEERQKGRVKTNVFAYVMSCLVASEFLLKNNVMSCLVPFEFSLKNNVMSGSILTTNTKVILTLLLGLVLAGLVVNARKTGRWCWAPKVRVRCNLVITDDNDVDNVFHTDSDH